MLSCICFPFYICELETLGEAVVRRGFLVLLSPDHFAFFYFFIFFAPIEVKKIRFIFPLTHKIMAESMSLKSKTKKIHF